MGGLHAKNSPAMALPGSQKVQGSLETATQQVQGSLGTSPSQGSKPKKKICCACPETKKLRDECIVEYGEEACAKWIDAHRQCLRAEGFNI